MKRNCLFVLGLLTIAMCAGCGSGNATLYVDNDSKEGMRVEIEGHRGLYVGPGKSGKRHLPFGEHKIVVKQKGKVIYDGTKVFEPHKNGPAWRHYLLDPEKNTRYTLREIYYYKDKDKEKAKKGKKSRRVRTLAKKHWVDVPKGATALYAMPVVVTSEKGDRTSTLCVVRSK